MLVKLSTISAKLAIRKIRVEVEDERGNKYTFTITSPINRDKVAQFIDLVEMMAGPSATEFYKSEISEFREAPRSKFEKLFSLIIEKFPLNWFTSGEIQVAYEEKFKEPISLSTVSTYLSRYFDKGWLTREGPSNMLKYRLNPKAITELNK
jgi:hypothetical protein